MATTNPLAAFQQFVAQQKDPSSPTRPAIPSIILTATLVSGTE